ncbi:MAG: DUF2071 domain-containing protein [Bacteroidetes bacterium]|nr:MAG: DUF2071 domain-containing protein [Bacteroidota bacterium]
MSGILLSAHWTNLLVANYEVDKHLLEKFLPARTELNDWNGKYFISLVGFQFSKTKLLGIPSPFYRSFPEINLRFYVKRKIKDGWRKGVVFIKEIAPAKLIGYMASLLYNENFITLPLKSQIRHTIDKINIEYSFPINNHTNYVKAIVNRNPANFAEETLESFIADHYWGYTRVNEKITKEFQIIHPPWKIHPVLSSEIKIDGEKLYGNDFTNFMTPPFSIFLMDGSETKVTRPLVIKD